MASSKPKLLTFAEKCKNIFASNWQGKLSTVKADSAASKKEIYSSMVKFTMRKGKPCIWVHEKDLHNVNAVIDERASFGVVSHFPGPLASLLRSMNKLPARVALTGELVLLDDKKVTSAVKTLKELVTTEQNTFVESSYALYEILNSSASASTSWSGSLSEVLNTVESYAAYKFNTSSCMFIDGNGGTHDVDLEDFELSKADKISCSAAKLVDGINGSESRRRALVIFCLVFLNENVKDAYVQWVDRKGFNVFGNVTKDNGEQQWKDFRFTFEEAAQDADSFCHKLLEMEEKALENWRRDQIRNLNHILRAEILSLSTAIVVSRPRPESKRKDFAFYVRDLFARLQIVGVDFKEDELS
ncbi:hypothetical protein AKJ16_DCAP11876 [Drosera capensis]